MEENMFNKSYDWACTLLWTSICLTLLILGWTILYMPYWCSLTIVAVLLALFIIMGYIQYARVLALKHKFMIVQETFTTLALVYFTFYYFSEQNQIPSDSVLKKMRQKIDNVYALSRDYFTMPLVINVLKNVSELKDIQGAVKNEIKNFASTDGFSVENAQIIASKVTNLFQKIRQLIDMIAQGFSVNTQSHHMTSKQSLNTNDTVNVQSTNRPKRVKAVKSKMSKSTKTGQKMVRRKNKM